MIENKSSITMSLIRMNIIQAEQAIGYFNTNKLKSIKNAAAYNLQQACEKLIKIQIYNSGVNVSNHKMYTHNLSNLVLYANSLGVKLICVDYVLDNLDKITDWEAESRYNYNFSVRIDTLERCYSEVNIWYLLLRKKGYI